MQARGLAISYQVWRRHTRATKWYDTQV